MPVNYSQRVASPLQQSCKGLLDGGSATVRYPYETWAMGCLLSISEAGGGGVRHGDSEAIGPGLSEVEEASNQPLVDINSQEQCCLKNKSCLPPPQHRPADLLTFRVCILYKYEERPQES